MVHVSSPANAGKWVLISAIFASSMAFIDSSALNVALPALQDDLNATGNQLLWIVNAYALFLAALILVGGSLGDHLGRKRVFMQGIILFASASLVCGFAPSTEILIFARAVQGIGGAMMVPGSLSLISSFFDGANKGQAIGTWSAFATLTTMAGPILGGFLAEYGLWRGVFFINLPIALIALYILRTRVPESRDDEVAAQPLDWLGAFLITIALAGITYGFIEGSGQGWETPLIIFTLGGGFLALGLFIVWEARTPYPMVPLGLFKSMTFSGTNLMTLFLYGALSGALFFLPLNLVQVQGYRQNEAGLAMLPFAIILTLMSRWAGGLVDKYGPRLPLTVGPIITGTGFILFTLPGQTDGFSDYLTSFFPAAVLYGIGMGITVAPLTATVMNAVPQNRSGVASGVNNAVSRSAGVLAIAIMGAIALVFFSDDLSTELAATNLPNEVVTDMKDNADRLANIEIPENLASPQQKEAETAIHRSFIDTFRLMNFIGAGLAWTSALMSALFIRRQTDEESIPAAYNP